VIAVRNEAHNIEGLFKSLFAQSISSDCLEIIIVDDHSTDETLEKISLHAPLLKNLLILSLGDHLQKGEKILSYKKKALELGIQQSTGELIVTTDADCRFPSGWLSMMSAFYQTKKAGFIAAPVKILANRSLVSVFQTLDFLTLQGITAASVNRKFHTLCNGANLAYPKSTFEEVKGFEGINALASGDDLLLMQKIFKMHPEKVYYLKSQEAIVNTAPVLTWKELWHQRVRWASKSKFYDELNIKLVLLLVYLLNFNLLLLFLVSVFSGKHLFLLILLVIAKFLIEYSFVDKVARFFKQENLMLFFFILQPLHILYIVAAGSMGLMGGFEWKGRKIKK
jgi:glycosyltransferase involved in cell wall biosynthesis